MRINKQLIVFALIYNAITLFLFKSPPLAWLFFYPAFVIIAMLTLGLLHQFKKIKIYNRLDNFLLFFSTPAPAIIIGFISMFFPAEPKLTSTNEYTKNGHRHKELQYEYESGDLQRIEYFTSKETVDKDTHLVKKFTWIKDSVWTDSKN